MFSHTADEVAKHGYAVLRAHDPSRTSVEVASAFGVVARLAGVEAVQRLTPKSTAEADDNVYSGHFGLSAFPLHSDLAHWHVPPRFLMLRSVVPGLQTATRLLDFRSLVHELPRDMVQRSLFVPRRPVGGQKSLLKLSSVIAGHEICRWDPVFIESASQTALELRQVLVATLARAATVDVSLDGVADTIIIDNWRMLHGRSPVVDTDRCRVVQRVYLRSLHAS